mgnify:CR=1 FL=1
MAGPALPAEARLVDFKRQILPILKEACFECHAGDSQKGRLRLDQRDAAVSGGRTGPAIVPGKAELSELYKRILLPRGNKDRMPHEGEPLARVQVDLIRDWINQGAAWPEDAGTAAARPGTAAVRRGRTDLEVSPADLVEPGRAMSEVIDHYIDIKLNESGVIAAPQSDDAELVQIGRAHV